MARPSDAVQAQQIMAYHFQNIDLLREALQAPGPGAMLGGIPIRDGSKRLSLLGISVITTAISLACYNSGVRRGKCSQFWKV